MNAYVRRVSPGIGARDAYDIIAYCTTTTA